MESSVKGNPRIGTHAARIQGNEEGVIRGCEEGPGAPFGR